MNIPLKMALIETGKRQGEVARALGVSESKMSLWVRGYRLPTEAEMRAIAKVLRRPVQQLFPDTEQCA
jgi:transcriptional regulator with XRE-family HTH domain